MKRLNNKTLIISLVALVAVFVLTRLFRSPGLESNLKAETVKIDTAKVTEIKIYPASEAHKEFRLVKDGKTWKAIRESITAGTQPYALNEILRSVASVKTDRIVTRKKEKWNDYQVGDSTGTEVKFLNGKEELGHLWIGKQSGSQTFIRQANEEQVLSIEGYWQGIFNKKFNDWRDPSFLRIDKKAVTKVTVKYPADSGFVLSKIAKAWMLGKEKADTTKVDSYLSKFQAVNLSSFVDNFKPSMDPQVTITLEDDSKPLATIKGWLESPRRWIVTSDQKPDIYFTSEGSPIVNDLLVGRKKLLPGK